MEGTLLTSRSNRIITNHIGLCVSSAATSAYLPALYMVTPYILNSIDSSLPTDPRNMVTGEHKSQSQTSNAPRDKNLGTSAFIE